MTQTLVAPEHGHAETGHAQPLKLVYQPALPLGNGKLFVWLFLSTEIMFFAALIGVYIVRPVRSRDLAKHARGASERADRFLQYGGADFVQRQHCAGT